jgi:hypothetical protein
MKKYLEIAGISFLAGEVAGYRYVLWTNQIFNM